MKQLFLQRFLHFSSIARDSMLILYFYTCVLFNSSYTLSDNFYFVTLFLAVSCTPLHLDVLMHEYFHNAQTLSYFFFFQRIVLLKRDRCSYPRILWFYATVILFFYAFLLPSCINFLYSTSIFDYRL